MILLKGGTDERDAGQHGPADRSGVQFDVLDERRRATGWRSQQHRHQRHCRPTDRHHFHVDVRHQQQHGQRRGSRQRRAADATGRAALRFLKTLSV